LQQNDTKGKPAELLGLWLGWTWLGEEVGSGSAIRIAARRGKLAGVSTAILNYIYVALGGALGSMARFAVQSGAHGLAKALGFPVGTFIVNMVGCFLIGVFFGRAEKLPLPEPLRPLLVIGFLGGFTTFSSFGFETFEMLRAGGYGEALGLLNAFGQCVLGFLLVWLGVTIAKSW
jgi:fluoride exporter